MNSHVSSLVAALVVTLMSQTAQAEPVKVWGAGAETCKNWQQAQAHGSEWVLKQWLFGFVSAHNYYTAQQVQLPEAKVEAAYAHVVRYCERHPSHGVTAAAASYVKSLGGQSSSPAAGKV